MISKILVPLDGSKVAQKAAKYAVDPAKQTGAALTLLSVIDKRFIIEQAVSASASPTHLKESVADYLKRLPINSGHPAGSDPVVLSARKDYAPLARHIDGGPINWSMPSGVPCP